MFATVSGKRTVARAGLEWLCAPKRREDDVFCASWFVLLWALFFSSVCCVILDCVFLCMFFLHPVSLWFSTCSQGIEDWISDFVWSWCILLIFAALWAKFPALALLFDVFGCWILSFWSVFLFFPSWQYCCLFIFAHVSLVVGACLQHCCHRSQKPGSQKPRKLLQADGKTRVKTII